MKNGIIIGALIGIACGLIGVMVTLHLMSNEMIERETEAHKQGYAEGMKRVGADGVDISAKLNEGMIEENHRLGQQVRSVKTALMALQSRDDLTPQAKDQVAGILAGLE